MTRANLNFTYREKGQLKVLYYYQNGDQYPQGIRDYYHVLDLLKDFTPQGFKKWLGDNYTETKAVAYSNTKTGATIVDNWAKTDLPAKPKLQHFTIIGDLTDYTYVFNDNSWLSGVPENLKENTIQVYNWDEQIFNGNVKEFTNWIKKQK